MRKLALSAFMGLFLSAAAYAQIPSGNIFVGYSYSRSAVAPGTSHTVNLNGWEGSLEGKFLPWIGIVADFSAAYGSNNLLIAITCPIPGCVAGSTSVRRYTYMFGPRVSVPVGKFTPFAHFLLGAAHANEQGFTDASFATAIGGGLDYRLIHGLAWRLQADELHTRFFGGGQDHLRFSTGIDIRF